MSKIILPTKPAILLTTSEAAERLGLSPRTLEKWRITGGGPRFLKLGEKLVKYLEDDLDSWLEGRAFTSTSDPGRRMMADAR